MSRKLTSEDVLERLSDLFVHKGVPDHIRSDNGSEFTSKRGDAASSPPRPLGEGGGEGVSAEGAWNQDKPRSHATSRKSVGQARAGVVLGGVCGRQTAIGGKPFESGVEIGQLQVVPEPSTVVLAAVGAMLAVGRMRRRS